jgi:hypothetical protein
MTESTTPGRTIMPEVNDVVSLGSVLGILLSFEIRPVVAVPRFEP